jgi:hypothetical protein
MPRSTDIRWFTGGVRSIELTLADPDDTAFRAGWDALAAAGLPSQAAHRGASNRPHVTVAAGDDLPMSDDLPELPDPPGTLRLGGLLLFPSGADRVVLVRAVVVDAALAAFHRAVHAAAPGGVPNTLPDRWSPHVTLAHRMPIADLPAALAALGTAPALDEVTIAGVRHWDGATTTVTPLTTR